MIWETDEGYEVVKGKHLDRNKQVPGIVVTCNEWQLDKQASECMRMYVPVHGLVDEAHDHAVVHQVAVAI